MSHQNQFANWMAVSPSPCKLWLSHRLALPAKYCDKHRSLLQKQRIGYSCCWKTRCPRLHRVQARNVSQETQLTELLCSNHDRNAPEETRQTMVCKDQGCAKLGFTTEASADECKVLFVAETALASTLRTWPYCNCCCRHLRRKCQCCCWGGAREQCCSSGARFCHNYRSTCHTKDLCVHTWCDPLLAPHCSFNSLKVLSLPQYKICILHEEASGCIDKQ